MKKILYIALTDYENPADGVSIKVHAQIAGMEELGYEVFCASYGKDGVYLYERNKKFCLGRSGKTPNRVLLFKALAKYVKTHKFDVCYIRFPYMDFWLKRILKELKTQSTKIYVEIPTYPMSCPTRQEGGTWAMILFKIQYIWMRDINKYIDKVLYIGNPTGNIWGCESELIENGCDIHKYALKKLKTKKFKELKLIAVAGMFARHGYERLLYGMINYYKKGSYDVIVRLAMVGIGPELENYKKITMENDIDQFVEFCGVKSGRELDALFNESDIAVAALGMYKENIQQASTLKVKEYMSRGIPFIYACEEMNLAESMPYVLKVENNNCVLDVQQVVRFYEDICTADYREEMRAYAEEQFSWKKIYSSILRNA